MIDPGTTPLPERWNDKLTWIVEKDPDDTVKLEITKGNDAPMLAYLTNTVGQTIKIYTVKQGINWLNLENFARGIYFLQIQTDPDNRVVRKLVIQ